ncbi:MAG: radical SAM protein [Eubacteriales bacterium]|nr:radical SAM protein [Eubacteriales bacterium]
MHYADYKTILSPQNGMNLYRGCLHGCIYCDSRSVCYQMKHDFEDIEVKRDAVRILEQELRRKRKPCMIGTGAMCDPYLPLERELKLTRQCLQLIRKYGCGVSVLTKSADILRDLDVLKQINAQSKCVVQMTLTTADETLCRKLEPNVSTTKERIETLKIMRDEGIPTVVWLSPFLPFINDTEQNLRALLDACVEVQAKGVMCFGIGVTLREGDREYFYSKLDQLFPGMKQRYVETFGNAYLCDSPNNGRLMALVIAVCKEHGMLYHPQEVFAYLQRYESKTEQMSMF